MLRKPSVRVKKLFILILASLSFEFDFDGTKLT